MAQPEKKWLMELRYAIASGTAGDSGRNLRHYICAAALGLLGRRMCVILPELISCQRSVCALRSTQRAAILTQSLWRESRRA